MPGHTIRRTVFAAALVVAALPAWAATPSQILQVLIPPPPEPGAQFGLLYADPQKRTIMEYDLGRVENDKVYFTDGHKLFDIDDATASMLANTPFQPSRFAMEHGLTQLPSQILGLSGPASIVMRDLGAPKCQWPYATTATFALPRRPPIMVMFLHRRDVPRTAAYEAWCEGGPGEIQLTTAYEIIVPTVVLDADGAPLVAFRRPAVVFRLNESGRVIGPNLDGGIIAVPAGLGENLLSMVTEGEMAADVAIKVFEADVGVISREQNAP